MSWIMWRLFDCGTPINPNLARVQTEGGIAQGIGMALWEDVQYTDKGKIRNNSFMQYKIPTRQDIGNIRVDLSAVTKRAVLLVPNPLVSL